MLWLPPRVMAWYFALVVRVCALAANSLFNSKMIYIEEDITGINS